MKIKYLKLLISSILLVGCMDNDNHSLKSDSSLSLGNSSSIEPIKQTTAYYHPNSEKNDLSSKFTSNTTTTLIKDTQDKNIYKCTLANGEKVFTDRHCNNHEETIALNQLRPNIAAAYHAHITKTNHAPTTFTNHENNNQLNQPASAYEINTRYDNLAREIKSLFNSDEKSQLNNALMQLEQDRAKALAMKTSSKQPYDINNRFDNLEKDIHAHSKGGARAFELLRIENLRNQALYHY